MIFKNQVAFLATLSPSLYFNLLSKFNDTYAAFLAENVHSYRNILEVVIRKF